MGRYRCPSSSFASSSSQTNLGRRLSQVPVHGNGESSKAAGPSNSDGNKKRYRSGIDRTRAKIAMREEALRRRAKARNYSYVYVGNVDPTVDETVLYKAFSNCGQITRIQIRCSRGGAIKVGQPVEAHLRTERDRQYATVEFAEYDSIRKALGLDGRLLHGVPIVVTVSAGDLPEVKDIITRRVKTLNGGLFPSSRIYGERTEPVIGPRDPEADKHKFMGITFPKCVM